MAVVEPAGVAAGGRSPVQVAGRRRGGGPRGSRSAPAVIGRYVAGRLAQGVFVLLGAIVISFALVNISGNPSDVLLNPVYAPAQQREAFAATLGYDRPFLERLGEYVGNAARGDLGKSYRDGTPAIDPVLKALPYTAVLAGAALLLALLVSVPTAVYSVLHRESFLDRMLRRFLLLTGSLPDFWVALVLVIVFAVNFSVFPVSGSDGPSSLVLPVLSLTPVLIPPLVRLLRGLLLDTATKDYVVGLRAKGFSDRYIMWHQGLKNASVPFVTWVALQLGTLIGGTLIIEIVFSWPGLGFLLNTAVQTRDLEVIQAIVVVIAASYVVLNLLADLLVLAIDPRVRTAMRT